MWPGAIWPGDSELQAPSVQPAVVFAYGTPYFQWAAGTPGFEWSAGTPYLS